MLIHRILSPPPSSSSFSFLKKLLTRCYLVLPTPIHRKKVTWRACQLVFSLAGTMRLFCTAWRVVCYRKERRGCTRTFDQLLLFMAEPEAMKGVCLMLIFFNDPFSSHTSLESLYQWLFAVRTTRVVLLLNAFLGLPTFNRYIYTNTYYIYHLQIHSIEAYTYIPSIDIKTK